MPSKLYRRACGSKRLVERAASVRFRPPCGRSTKLVLALLPRSHCGIWHIFFFPRAHNYTRAGFQFGLIEIIYFANEKNVMAFRDSRTIAIIIYSGFLVVLADARSWDFAVTIGREVHFFANNGTPLGDVKTRDAVDLSGIAWDDNTHTMFLSDTKNPNLTLFSKNFLTKDFDTQMLFKSQRRRHIFGLAYDARTKHLFWSDSTEEALMTMHVSSNATDFGVPKILLRLTDKSPRGISLDACNRRLYWANSNTSNPSIESSNLDGSERITVINTNLYEPLGVTVDHSSGKLYWIDDEEGIGWKIERSNLNGANRELLVHGRHQQPYNLAVDRQAIYWSDWTHSAIWTIKKDAKPDDEHYKLISFIDSNPDSDPKSIVTRDNIGDVDCPAMFEAQRRNTIRRISETSEEETENNLITSTEVGNSIVRTSDRCLNGGTHDGIGNVCQCRPGFDGQFCEISMCHNYCLHGECHVDDGGQPRCTCAASYQGLRCESNICDGFCLNGGLCSIKNNEPFCVCKSSFGSRCENGYEIDEICAIFCASELPALSSIDTSSCRCPNVNETMTTSNALTQEQWYKTLIIGISTLLGILTIVVGVLSYYVNRLRRRPRVKKRFVVSKAGITPLTARPELPSDQCEIMIENCCNMNICETPCFEPKLRNGEANVHKKDEKNSLLDNMEGNSC